MLAHHIFLLLRWEANSCVNSAFFFLLLLLAGNPSFLPPINVTFFFILVKREYWLLDMTEQQSVIYVSKV